MVSSHIRRLFRRRMDLRIRIRTAYALGHPRAPRRKNTPALSVHRQYIITTGDCQSSCHNCIYRQIFSAAHLAFSANLWYTEYGTQLNIAQGAKFGISYLSFSCAKSCVPTIGDTLCRACLRLEHAFFVPCKKYFRRKDMKCSKCGTEYEGNFCPKCGTAADPNCNV